MLLGRASRGDQPWPAVIRPFEEAVVDSKLRELQRRVEAGNRDAVVELCQETLRSVSILRLVSSLPEKAQLAVSEQALKSSLIQEALEAIDVDWIQEQVVERIVGFLSTEEVSHHIDVSEVADNIDLGELASEIDDERLSEMVASQIDLDDVSENIVTYHRRELAKEVLRCEERRNELAKAMLKIHREQVAERRAAKAQDAAKGRVSA